MLKEGAGDSRPTFFPSSFYFFMVAECVRKRKRKRMFFDLNVPAWSSEEEAQKFRNRALTFGWDCIASTTAYKRDTLKKAAAEGAPKSDLHYFVAGEGQGEADAHCKAKQTTLLQISRIHLEASDIEENINLISRCRKTYDLVSCQPVSEESFRKICTIVDCDIISIDLSKALPFRLQANHVQAALKRGLVFEISYSRLLQDDDTIRRNFFSGAKFLCRCTRGKGIILSSGTNNLLDLRSPSDIINIGSLLDLKGALAKKAVEATCRSLIDRVMRSKVFPKGFGLKEKGERPDGDEHLRKRQKC